MKQFNRTHRINEVMHRELARLLVETVADPRIGWVTITAVKVSKDLGQAKVYISTLQEEAIAESIKVLNAAAGFLRTELSHSLNLRIIPRLRFYYDESIRRGQRLNALIESVTEIDYDESPVT